MSNTRRVLVNDKGSNLMAPPLDQMLEGGSAPVTKTDSSSNLLHLPPAMTSNTGVSSTSSVSRGDIMDQRRANVQRSDYQHQGE